MKKSKMLLMILSLLLILSGCATEEKKAEQTESNVEEQSQIFETLIIEEINGTEYTIMREKKTDVIYLTTDENVSGGGGASITVMVEEDGSPLTYNEWLQMEEE